MRRIRRSARREGAWTLLLVVLALACRLLIPAGYMPAAEAAGWRMAPCSGHGPMIAAPRRSGPHQARHAAPDCGFSPLTQAAAGGAPAPLPAVIPADQFAPALSVCAPAPAPRTERLRPPLRAPPA